MTHDTFIAAPDVDEVLTSIIVENNLTFSYITHMTRTTKAVYKECSHRKEAQKHAHGRHD
jgi:hypothetical protein